MLYIRMTTAELISILERLTLVAMRTELNDTGTAQSTGDGLYAQGCAALVELHSRMDAEAEAAMVHAEPTAATDTTNS